MDGLSGGLGAPQGFIDDGLAGGVGGEQGGDGEPVDGAGQAAGVAVDGAGRVVGEQGVGPPGQRQVSAEVPGGPGGGQGGGGAVVPELDPLVQGGHVTDPEPAPQGGLADQHDGGRGPGVDPGGGEQSDSLELVVRGA